MPSPHPRGSKDKPKLAPYRLIKIYTTEGKASTVSLNKNLYEVIEHKVGAKATLAIAKQAAKEYETAKTDQTRSAYVVQALQNTFGVGHPPRIEVRSAQKRARAKPNPYQYVKLRVRGSQGNLTTVSFPPPFMARVRRQLTEEQIQEIADKAAASYDDSVIFTRSEHIKRALKTRIGEKVPSEVKLIRAKFKLSPAQLASILQVSETEVARWEERGEMAPGPARMMLVTLWKGQLKLSAVFNRKQPGR